MQSGDRSNIKMIEIVTIDHEQHEFVSTHADLMRFATSFFAPRLFSPKQQKKLKMVIELSAQPGARPISRDQLASRPGLFQSKYYQFDCAVSLAGGFDSAMAQFTHELIHVSQILSKRYEIIAKTKKSDGQKQTIYHAKWLGKKQGAIDDMQWDLRPWEQEALFYSQQIMTEFRALISGAQTDFPKQGKKQEFPLMAVSFAMPAMPEASGSSVPQPIIASHPATSAPMTNGQLADLPADNLTAQPDQLPIQLGEPAHNIQAGHATPDNADSGAFEMGGDFDITITDTPYDGLSQPQSDDKLDAKQVSDDALDDALAEALAAEGGPMADMLDDEALIASLEDTAEGEAVSAQAQPKNRDDNEEIDKMLAATDEAEPAAMADEGQSQQDTEQLVEAEPVQQSAQQSASQSVPASSEADFVKPDFEMPHFDEARPADVALSNAPNEVAVSEAPALPVSHAQKSLQQDIEADYKDVYIQGVDAPRRLGTHAVSAKRDELEKRGLLKI